MIVPPMKCLMSLAMPLICLAGWCQPPVETIILKGNIYEPVTVSVAGRIMRVTSLPFSFGLPQRDIPTSVTVTSENYRYAPFFIQSYTKEEYKEAERFGEKLDRVYIVYGEPLANSVSTVDNKSDRVADTVNPTPQPLSDVDTGIPVARESRDDVFALVIANEHYQDVACVDNAINDGEVVAAYCRTALGLPEKNVRLVKDATLGNIKREINLMRQIAGAYGGKAAFLVYYAGHGVPDELTRGAYLLPVDGFAADISTCYSLSDLYAVLGEMPSAKTIVLLDACFSGATRQGGTLASARGVAIRPKVCVPGGNTLVIASASGDETAYSYKEKGHGMFTYFLLKKIKEKGGGVKLGELVEYVRDNVSRLSLVVNGKSQTPTATPSPSVGSSWTEWGLD